MADGWRGRTMTQGRDALFPRENDVSRGKPPAAVASVIVGPTSTKYDSLVGANRSGAIVHKEPPSGRFYPSKLEGESVRFGESRREPGAGRVIQPLPNMEDKCAQSKNSFMHGPLSSTSSLSRSAVVVSAVDVQNKPQSQHFLLGMRSKLVLEAGRSASRLQIKSERTMWRLTPMLDFQVCLCLKPIPQEPPSPAKAPPCRRTLFLALLSSSPPRSST
ncbi:hypothetical protein FQA47_020457 [Oryzias melastigma]|uniref:Uncharacterized protein n=1 Tax=Oryzias melastigma TaxID=30732 RepID=A0A834F4N7_ORYME|nr:hypothetical protein FQA47_020457 [Oryzias melastigma]